MPRQFWKAAADPLLALARAVRDGRTTPPAEVPVPPGRADDDPKCVAVRAAMARLAEELAVVRAGKGGPWAAP